MNYNYLLNKQLFRIFLITTLMFSAFFLQCSRQSDPDQVVLATIGQRELDWRIIRRSFNLDPQWSKGITTRQAYKNQLDYLINQKLFAQEAVKNHLDEKPELAEYLKSIKEKEMIKELYRREVADKVEIMDDEYRTAYARMKKKVQIDYIRTPDSIRAQGYLQQLGELPLEKIELLVPEQEEKGRSQMFSYGDMDERLEDIVYELELGETAGPVKIRGDFMVVRLIDGSREKFLSEMDYQLNKNKINKVIFERRAAKISDRYIYQLLKDQEIRINPDVFFPLAEQFSNNVKNKNSETPFPLYLSDQELNLTRHNLEQMKDRDLVTFQSGSITLGQFLQNLANMPVGIRPQVNMAPQLKKAIAVMVRNHYLAEEAYDRKIDKSAVVGYETRNQQDDVLARLYLKNLRNSIHCSREEIEAFKAKENFEDVNKMLDGNLTDDKIRDVVEDYKFIMRKQQMTDSLRSIYPVTVDSTSLVGFIQNPDELIDYDPIKFFLQEGFN